MDGIIVVNKEKGMTSFDVVHEISKIFNIKRVGHTGTLDPMAEGVLIVCIGKACKVIELITSTYKEYIANVVFGIKTDSYDTDGNIIDRSSVPDNLDIEGVINVFLGTYMQEVPIYSAVKVNGKKLYEYARKGESVELPKREVEIKEIELLDKSIDKFSFRCVVSKGTYIRSLINDIGNKLGCYACMSKLTRTMNANISINDAYTLDDIRSGNYKLLSIDEVLDIPIVVVDADLEFRIKNGQIINNEFNIEDKVIFKNKNNDILGIYQNIDNKLKVWKNF